jgi:hypothetical protein
VKRRWPDPIHELYLRLRRRRDGWFRDASKKMLRRHAREQIARGKESIETGRKSR